MLHQFVVAHRNELIRRCRIKVLARTVPPATPAELEYAVPRFLDELVVALQSRPMSNPPIDRSAAHHGRDLHLQGFTASQVVHDYGDVCQSITDLAVEAEAPIPVEDFRTLNACLDDAIASVVTEHGRTDAVAADAGQEWFGYFLHEIRNLLNTATLAFEVLDTGNVGVRGSTGSVLKRSLSALRDLVNHSTAEVRLLHDLHDRVPIVVAELLEEVETAAELQAAHRELRFVVQRGDVDAVVYGDRQVLRAIVVNLLQNAFKFTLPGTSVRLSATASGDRVLIEVADECGGLHGNVEELFRPFEQRHANRTGLGLGLSFSRRGAEANGGRLVVRNLPGCGCVFTLDLPRMPAAGTVPPP